MKKAKYIKLLTCPECGFYRFDEEPSMANRDDFLYEQDNDGKEYVLCPACNCKFKEKDDLIKELKEISYTHFPEGIIEVEENSDGYVIDKDDYEKFIKRLKEEQ